LLYNKAQSPAIRKLIDQDIDEALAVERKFSQELYDLSVVISK